MQNNSQSENYLAAEMCVLEAETPTTLAGDCNTTELKMAAILDGEENPTA